MAEKSKPWELQGEFDRAVPAAKGATPEQAFLQALAQGATRPEVGRGIDRFSDTMKQLNAPRSSFSEAKLKSKFWLATHSRGWL